MLVLDISQGRIIKPSSKQIFTKNLTTLSTEDVILLISVFNIDQVPFIIDLMDDKNLDPHIFQLNIPVSVDVRIQYLNKNKFEIAFADNEPFTADQIYKQVITSLDILKSKECILAIFSNTDPIDTKFLLKNFNRFKPIIAFIPDEDTFNEEIKTTYVEIIFPNIDDQMFKYFEQEIRAYFKNIELANCKKCNMLFCPANKDEICYRYFHRGEQIPFEYGQMEEVEYCEEEEEVIFYVNYSCCGECPKDEIPFNCGRQENGQHEIDKCEGIVSKLTIIKTHPGHIPYYSYRVRGKSVAFFYMAYIMF